MAFQVNTEIYTTVLWTIEKITSFRKYGRGEGITSPEFQTPSYFPPPGRKYPQLSSWTLTFYPNGHYGHSVDDFDYDDDDEHEFTSIVLYLKDSGSITHQYPAVPISCETDISDFVLSFDHEFNSRNPSALKRFVKRAVSKDQVTITCKIGINNQTVRESNLSISLSKDFSDFLSTGVLTDFIIFVNNKSFPCHKAILAARSPVFCAMFNTNMTETQSSTMSIEDLDETTVQGLLEYVYSGTVRKLDELAEPLLAAAEKYQMPNLKDQCQHSLLKIITLENAASLLMLADFYILTTLKNKAVQLICDNKEKFITTDGWQQLKKAPNSLIAELFETLTLRNTK